VQEAEVAGDDSCLPYRPLDRVFLREALAAALYRRESSRIVSRSGWRSRIWVRTARSVISSCFAGSPPRRDPGLSPAKGIAAALGVAVSELAKAAERLEG
jgi:hypothetical protein